MLFTAKIGFDKLGKGAEISSNSQFAGMLEERYRPWELVDKASITVICFLNVQEIGSRVISI